ncbi:MAG: signal peptide peptidase SppA, partial [Candidatus Aminicenantales bacterium]
TAYNIFTETGFTPAHKEMMESIYSNLFNYYLKTTAEARGKSVPTMRNLVDKAFFQGEEALKAGLVDKLLFEDQLAELLKENGRKLSRLTHRPSFWVKPSSLIYGQGLIHSGQSFYQTMGSSTIAKWIKNARNDKSILGIVFRVDSPGGSAVASDTIWREVVLAKKEKPFVVSMSDVAGSGGYWVSMAAHKIVAQPQTLTGSIGVLAGKFNLAGFYKKLGITSEKLTYGQKADFFSSFRGFTGEERKILKNEILWIYDRFLAKAAQGRKMSMDEINKLGKGRVWTGSQAQKLGLVDEIGGLTKAINLTKKLAGIPAEEEVKLIVWPRKISLWQALFGRRLIRTKSELQPQFKEIISQLRVLEKDNILAIMPFYFLGNN